MHPLIESTLLTRECITTGGLRTISAFTNLVTSPNEFTGQFPNLVDSGGVNVRILVISVGTGLSSYSAKFCDIIFNLNFSQLICEPTHIAGNVLDLIITNIPDLKFNVNIHSEPPLSIPSDHYIITFDVQTIDHEVHHNKAMESFDFAKGVSAIFLSSSDFSPCFESNYNEHMWCYISDLIKNAICTSYQEQISESAQVVQFLYKTQHQLGLYSSM